MPRPKIPCPAHLLPVLADWTLQQIADAGGVSQPTALRWRRAHVPEGERRGPGWIPGRKPNTPKTRKRRERAERRRDRAVELYQQGLTMEQAGNEVGVSRERVRQYLQDAGVASREDAAAKGRIRNGRKRRDARWKQIRPLVEKGMTDLAIGEATGIPAQTVGAIRRAHDVAPAQSRRANARRARCYRMRVETDKTWSEIEAATGSPNACADAARHADKNSLTWPIPADATTTTTIRRDTDTETT